MKKIAFIIIAIILGITGCAKENTAEELADNRPSLKDIQSEYQLSDLYEVEDGVIGLIDDDELWRKMQMQLVTYQNERGYLTVSAVIKNNEKIVPIKLAWGSYIFEYVLVDLDNDGKSEMVGYYDWGSGIVRSKLFVLNSSGEFENITYLDKEQLFYLYDFFTYNSKIDAVTAMSHKYYANGEEFVMRLYYEDGKYCCIHENQKKVLED